MTPRFVRAWRRRAGRWAVPFTTALGVALFAYVVAEIGISRIGSTLVTLGPILPVVLFVTGFKYPLQAAAWRLALEPKHRPSWRAAVAATIAGDAIGYLTWAGAVTGEPLKAYLSRDSTPMAVGLAAGAAERLLYNVTAAIVILAAAALALRGRARLVVVGIVTVAAAGIVIWRVRRRVVSRVRRTASENGTPGRRARRSVAAALARRLFVERPQALGGMLACEVAQHAVLMLEAYVMLAALGAAPGWRAVIIFEGLTKAVNTVGAVVPGRLGIAEGGSAALADLLGLGASYGFGLAVMRRVRALVWGGVGLALLPARERRARRADQP